MSKAKLIPLGVGVTVAIFISTAYLAGLFFGFENFLGDTLISGTGTSGEIVIVTIDDESIARIGQWPWPRAQYGELIERLEDSPPKVLGIDVLFSESSRLGEKDDEKFANALAEAPFPVVLASRSADGVVPLEEFIGSENVRVGEVALLVDPDGIVRRTFILDSFASLVATRGKETISPKRINWAGPPGSFRRVPFHRFLEEEELAASLEGKIVLVGSTATDLHDEQLTAIAPGEAMPGVEIQANITNMLLEGGSFVEPSRSVAIFIILLAAVLPSVCFLLFAHLWQPILASFLIFLLWLVVTILSWQSQIALPILYPGLAWFVSTLGQILYRYFGLERSRREIRNLFGKYISRDVLEELLKNPSQVKLGGEEREVTVLFSDVRGFTTLSETMSPTELTQFLNRYLSRMTNVILSNKGVIDKYIGDAIMAFWGAPVINDDHAENAIFAATAMIDSLQDLNNENKEMGFSQIEIGIGLHSGKVVAGNMGSEQRFDYTLMGDTVNLSSRLESLTKFYSVGILASEGTLHRVGKERLEQQGILTREIDQVKVKGKTQVVRIFEIVPASKHELIGKILDWFNTAREFYYKGDWDKCLKMLSDIEKIAPSDGPTRVLRERCLQYKVVPPSEWTGVYEHKSK